MKKKWFIFFIIWATIFLLGYIYLYRKIEISASNCFNSEDNEILIISERKLVLDTLLKGPSESFFLDLYQNPKFKKASISLFKPKILLDFQFKLKEEYLETYFSKIHRKIIKVDGKYKLDNNWFFIFQDSSLFLFKGKLKQYKTNHTYSVLNSDFAIYNTVSKTLVKYFVHNNILKSIENNNYRTSFLNKSDKSIFSSYIPAGIDNYTFYEKKYAVKSLLIDEGTALDKIAKEGICFIKIFGKEYILVDTKVNIDPFSILDEEIGRKELVSGIRKNYTNVFLSSITPKLNESFYVDYVGDILVFAYSFSDFEKLKTKIELKQTLVTNKFDYQFVYGDLPTNIIFRTSSKDVSVSMTSIAKTFHKTLLIKNKSNHIKLTDKLEIENLKGIVGGRENIYVFTDEEILKIHNGKIKLKVKYKGELIGNPTLICNDDKEEIFFTTSVKLYLLDDNFDSIEDFPILLKNKPLLPFVRFDENSKMIGFSSTKVLTICDLSGNIEKRINVDYCENPQQISMFRNDVPFVVLNDKKNAYFFELEKKGLINKIDLSEKSTVFLTNNNSQALYYIKDSKLIRNDFNGDLKECVKGKQLRELKSFPNFEVLGLLSDKNFALFDSNGDIQTKIKLPENKINEYSLIESSCGNRFIILRNNLSKDIYIYTFDGQSVLEKPLKSDGCIFIHKFGRAWNIYTQFNNQLFRYIV